LKLLGFLKECSAFKGGEFFEEGRK